MCGYCVECVCEVWIMSEFAFARREGARKAKSGWMIGVKVCVNCVINL